MKVSELQPNEVFKYFELISSVPHGSENITQISELCCEFARKRGLRYVQDEIGNVIIFKSGTKGYEDHEPVIIQGHMDMVAVKTSTSEKDLLKDGLELLTDGKYLWADSTSLGADDGIALAMAMAVLDSNDIPHPPLEAVFTVNEETGMSGADIIDTSHLKGRKMLNIDSEEEGIITSGCAGGARVTQSFAYNGEIKSGTVLEIIIDGLTGGHSGNEIHKGRANALVMIGKLLSFISKATGFDLISVTGGEADNAIARKACAEITVCEKDIDDILEIVRQFKIQYSAHYMQTDPQMNISVNNLGNKTASVIPSNIAASIVTAMAEIPNGVIKMSDEIDGLVQTSVNLGTAETSKDGVKLTRCLRSSVNAEKEAFIGEIKERSENCGIIISGEYPAWEFISDSPLRTIAENAYKKLYGEAPAVTVIHAGLECGLFSSKIEGLDCISFGPDIHDIHTVNEKLDVVSAERTYSFLKEILKNL